MRELTNSESIALINDKFKVDAFIKKNFIYNFNKPTLIYRAEVNTQAEDYFEAFIKAFKLIKNSSASSLNKLSYKI